MKKLLEHFGQNSTIKELIQEIEDVQMFLMAIPSADRKLPEITLIDHAIMKLKTVGIYGKAIERWTAVASKTWLNFKKYFKSEYARIPKQGVNNTMAHEGY